MLTSWLPGTYRDDVAWADVADEFTALLGALASGTQMLSVEHGATPVHGDLGMHNILWDTAGRVHGLIDLDHAAIGDPAIDVAPLLGRFGSNALAPVVEPEVLRRAMIHRATLPLQVAAAAELVGDHHLRDNALRNFTRRRATRTLTDPEGATPAP